MRVVKRPVGNRSHGDATRELRRILGQHHQRQVAAVTPSEYADPVWINKVLVPEPVDTGDLITNFVVAQLTVDQI